MIFVIGKLKYDTDKMDLISDRCEYYWTSSVFGVVTHYGGKNVKLYRSKKDHWMLTYERDYHEVHGIALSIEDAQKLLLKYDVEAYEKTFGELEEA